MDTTLSAHVCQVDSDSLSSHNGNHENGTGAPGSNGAPIGEANGTPLAQTNGDGSPSSSGKSEPSVWVHEPVMDRFEPGHLVGVTKSGKLRVRLKTGEAATYPASRVFFHEGQRKAQSACGRFVIRKDDGGIPHVERRPRRERSARGDDSDRLSQDPTENDDRPIVLITTQEGDVADKAIEALEADPSIYQRNFKLICVARDYKPKLVSDIRRAEGTPVIRTIQEPRLRDVNGPESLRGC